MIFGTHKISRACGRVECLNGFSKEIHVMRVTEGEFDGNKRRRLGDRLFIATTIKATPDLGNKGKGVGVDPLYCPSNHLGILKV